jgi:hypothetical protein
VQVTGRNAPFFNSLLVFLQSFAERVTGQRLVVCDLGLSSAQAQFMRSLGMLLDRPLTLPRAECLTARPVCSGISGMMAASPKITMPSYGSMPILR